MDEGEETAVIITGRTISVKEDKPTRFHIKFVTVKSKKKKSKSKKRKAKKRPNEDSDGSGDDDNDGSDDNDEDEAEDEDEGAPLSIIGDLAREITCPAIIFTIKIVATKKAGECNIISIVKATKPKVLTLSKLKKVCITDTEYFKPNPNERKDFFNSLFSNARGHSSLPITRQIISMASPTMKGTLIGDRVWNYICKNAYHVTEDYYKIITNLGWKAAHNLSENESTLLLNTAASVSTTSNPDSYEELMRILLEVVRNGDDRSDAELKEMMNGAKDELREKLSIDLPRIIQAGVIYRIYTESVTTFNNTCLIEGTYGPKPNWLDESCDILIGTGFFNIRSNILVRMKGSDQSVRVIEEKAHTNLQADVCKYINNLKQVFVYHVDNDLDINYYQKLYKIYADQPRPQDIQFLTAVRNRTIPLGSKVTCIVNSTSDLGSFPSVKIMVVDRSHALDLKQMATLFKQYPRVEVLHLFGNKYTQPDGPGNPFYDIWKSGRFMNTNLPCKEMRDKRFESAQFIESELDLRLVVGSDDDLLKSQHILLPVKKYKSDIPDDILNQSNSILSKMKMNHQMKLEIDAKRREAVIISLKGADKDFLIRCATIIPVACPGDNIIILGSRDSYDKAFKTKKDRRMTSLIHDLVVTPRSQHNSNNTNKVK